MYTRKVLIHSFKFVLVEPAESIDNFSGAFINTRKGLSPKSQFLKNKNSFFLGGGGGGANRYPNWVSLSRNTKCNTHNIYIN